MHFPFFRRHKRSSVEKLAEKAGVVFGENNSFASCFWSSAEPYLIKIGSNCQITADVKIFTHGGSKRLPVQFIQSLIVSEKLR